MGLIALVLITALVIILANNSRRNNQSPAVKDTPVIGQADDSKKPESANSSLPSCSTTKELFTTFPVKDGEFSSITALGNLNPSSHTFPTDHIYVEVFDPQNPQNYTLDKAKSLLAPADIWITNIKSSERIGSVVDYALDFFPCKDVKGQFGHVGSISATLKSAIDMVEANCNEYETGGYKYRSCEYKDLKIQVKSGEKIGTAGSERAGMFDIWMSDYREPQVKRANSSRWNADRNYVSCFLDYFSIAQKTQYYGMLRGPKGGKRTKEPRCGTVEVDIAGTAQGVWFYNSTGQVQGEDQHLALAYDNIETDKQVFSVGTSASNAGISSAAYHFIPKTDGKVDRNFSQVTSDGAVYCYNTTSIRDGSKKSILLTMPSAEKLRLQKAPGSSCGSGPWTMSTGYVEFDR